LGIWTFPHTDSPVWLKPALKTQALKKLIIVVLLYFSLFQLIAFLMMVIYTNANQGTKEILINKYASRHPTDETGCVARL
jgi:hypothetical protein